MAFYLTEPLFLRSMKSCITASPLMFVLRPLALRASKKASLMFKVCSLPENSPRNDYVWNVYKAENAGRL